MSSLPSYRFCVAPMMDWTDRHCRFFMRLFSREMLLYTEMITTGALLYGDSARFLRHAPAEQPLALQLGGSEPEALAACAVQAAEAGYAEVNLNVGCPSDRVQNNRIGACLMADPERVADCVRAMRASVDIPITVKHRIGIGGHDSYAALCAFVAAIAQAGCRRIIVHARIAILEGLSPKQNREVPPLRYALVAALKKDFPDMTIVLNGGIQSLAQAAQHLKTFDGVMLGRAAYQNPYLLAGVDQTLFGSSQPLSTRTQMLHRLRPYLEQHLADGGSAHAITRHILGLANHLKGARRFRQLLSTEMPRTEHPLEIFDQASALLAHAETNIEPLAIQSQTFLGNSAV